MWPSFSGSYFPKRNFPSTSSITWATGPVREERTSEWCAAGLAYLQAVRRSVGHGPARLASPCSPGLEREFLLHSILNSLASGDRGARTSVVCTRPQICHSPGRAGQIRIFIWAAWLCYLMRHVKAECVTTGAWGQAQTQTAAASCTGTDVWTLPSVLTSFYFLPMATWFKVLLTVHFSVLVYCTGHIWTSYIDVNVKESVFEIPVEIGLKELANIPHWCCRVQIMSTVRKRGFKTKG